MDKLSGAGFSSSLPHHTILNENITHGNAEATYVSLEYTTQLPTDTTPLEKVRNLILKRSFDIVISFFLIIVLLSWLIPIIGIIIKLDSRGPVFFLQKRNKNGGHFFSCIKFRTMYINKDADILVAMEDDKRITRFGKFLRRHHLDELPQLFNVLIGDMSMIGPRPHMISENKFYEGLVYNYSYRHSVKPGITGLAQSLGNFGATYDLEKVKERTELDIHYIRNWSMKMDLKIICRTCLLVLGL